MKPPALPCAPGIGVALYDGTMRKSTLLKARTRLILGDAQPDIVMPHCGPRGILGQDPDDPHGDGAGPVVDELRKLLPTVRIWYGIGCDGWTDYLAANNCSAAAQKQVKTLLVKLSRDAVANGVEAIVWDQELAAKKNPTAGRCFAKLAVTTFREETPHILQGHTAYDHPISVPLNVHGYPAQPGEKVVRTKGGHLPYPFDEWYLHTPVDFAIDQTYVSDDPKVPAPPGALKRRHATSQRSFELLEQRGMMKPGLPRAHYNQVWGCPAAQIVNNELSSTHWFGWSLPGSRCDREGAVALVASAMLRRQNITTTEQVRELQRKLGVTVDGVVGMRETIPAIGIDITKY